jgi:hypothetical protein
MTDKLTNKPVGVLSADLRLDFPTEPVDPFSQLHRDAQMLRQVEDVLRFRFLPPPARQTNADGLGREAW